MKLKPEPVGATVIPQFELDWQPVTTIIRSFGFDVDNDIEQVFVLPPSHSATPSIARLRATVVVVVLLVVEVVEVVEVEVVEVEVEVVVVEVAEKVASRVPGPIALAVVDCAALLPSWMLPDGVQETK